MLLKYVNNCSLHESLVRLNSSGNLEVVFLLPAVTGNWWDYFVARVNSDSCDEAQ